jgi:hypothetical protein
MNLWTEIAKPIIGLRDGEHVMELMQDPVSARAYFASPWQMETANEILCAAFAAIGYIGHAAFSFRSFHEGLITRAKRIFTMPEDTPQKLGLTEMLVGLSELILTESSEAHKLMLKASIQVSVRPILFVGADTGGRSALEQFDKLMNTVLEDLSLRPTGMSRYSGAIPLAQTCVGGAQSSLLTASALGSTISPSQSASQIGTWQQDDGNWGQWSQGGGYKEGEWQNPKWDKSGAKYPPHISKDWGNAAHNLGVWVTPNGGLVLGKMLVTSSHASFPGYKGCAARWASKENIHERGRWCTTPGTCKLADHERLPGVEKKDIQVEDADLSTKATWTVVVAPGEPNEGAPSYKKQKGDGGYRNGNKGKGKDDKKGGKGKGKGKGGGKGKGFRGQQ